MPALRGVNSLERIRDGAAMKATIPASAGAKAWVALLLTLAAGYVDIVGFLGVYHTFTAQMTGTTVHLGSWLAEHNWGGATVAGTVIAAFVLGSIAGRILIEMGSRRGVRSIATVTLALETLLLAAFIPLASRATDAGLARPASAAALLAMLAAAMGLQTATLTRVGPLTVHTTFVTGMLNKLAQLVAHLILHTYDLLRAKLSDEKLIHQQNQRQALHNALFIFGIWCCYLAGAVAGRFMESRWKVQALYVPILLLLIGIAVDRWRPLSLEEGQDQPEK
jgi:uncharacterized membrane protein YoaK (UPF0700 family)